MYTSLVLRVVLLGLLLFDLTFRIQCIEYDTKCYKVAKRDICFFRPQFNQTWYTWYRANATCQRKNGSLPFIPDAAVQNVFEQYMNSLDLFPYTDDMWMAGREMRRKEWTWTNGVPFNEPPNFTLAHSEYNSYHLQAVLAEDLTYSKEYLGNTHYYVCQVFGNACQSRDAILLKSGCVILSDGVLDLYDARNKCMEKGADLAIIDGQDDLNKFRQVFSRIPKGAKIWIGLRRQWWMWNETGPYEMKYTNWLLDNGFRPNRSCMVYEVNDFLWKQENCTDFKRFICQIGPTSLEVSTLPTSTAVPGPSTGFLFFVVGVSSLVLTVLIVIIVLVVIAKKRKARLRQTGKKALTSTSYQQLQRMHENNDSRSNQQYVEQQPPSTKPQLPTPDRPSNSRQSEFIYDEIADTRSGGYIDIIR